MEEVARGDETDPRQVVADGYDRLHLVYADWSAAGHDSLRHRYIDLALAMLDDARDALDLGCGTGRHATARLVELGLTVTGVDISPRSIDVARQEVPEGTFIVADMATIDFAPSSFDLVVAFYSLIHVPRDLHGTVLARIATWLRPGGVAVMTMFGQKGSAYSYDDAWLGTARMYWSGWDADTNRALVAAAGLEVISADIETVDEDGKPVSFLWVVGRRPPSPKPAEHSIVVGRVRELEEVQVGQAQVVLDRPRRLEGDTEPSAPVMQSVDDQQRSLRSVHR